MQRKSSDHPKAMYTEENPGSIPKTHIQRKIQGPSQNQRQIVRFFHPSSPRDPRDLGKYTFLYIFRFYKIKPGTESEFSKYASWSRIWIKENAAITLRKTPVLSILRVITLNYVDNPSYWFNPSSLRHNHNGIWGDADYWMNTQKVQVALKVGAALAEAVRTQTQMLGGKNWIQGFCRKR